jgi:hypothetical protein
MVFPSCTPREPSASFAASGVKTQAKGRSSSELRPSFIPLFSGGRGRVILRSLGVCQACVSFTSSHFFASPQHVGSPRMLPDVGNVP